MRLIWLIIIGLFASPVLIPLALGFILVIGGLLIALLALIFSIYVLCISILGIGLFMIISGISVFGQSILSGLFFIGVGLFTGSAVFISPLLLKGTKGLFYVMMNFVKWMGRRFITKRDLHSAGALKGGQINEIETFFDYRYYPDGYWRTPSRCNLYIRRSKESDLG